MRRQKSAVTNRVSTENCHLGDGDQLHRQGPEQKIVMCVRMSPDVPTHSHFTFRMPPDVPASNYFPFRMPPDVPAYSLFTFRMPDVPTRNHFIFPMSPDKRTIFLSFLAKLVISSAKAFLMIF